MLPGCFAPAGEPGLFPALKLWVFTLLLFAVSVFESCWLQKPWLVNRQHPGSPLWFCFSRHLLAIEFLATNIYWDIKYLFGGVVKMTSSLVLSDKSRQHRRRQSLISRELRTLFTCNGLD